MKSLLKTIPVCLMALLFVGQSFAQTTPTDIKHIDVVYLNDGSEFRGKLIEYKHGEYVKIKIQGGQVVTFPAAEVTKVVQEDITPSVHQRQYAFKETGIYNETHLSYMLGCDDWNSGSALLHGAGLHHVAGYQHNRWIGGGMGFGIDAYYPGNGNNVMSVYLEARGYFLEKKVAPFYSLNLGYGIALKSPNLYNDVAKAKGGLMYNPSLGFRFGGHPQTNFTLALGYKVQKVSYSYQSWNDVTYERGGSFKRFNLKLGILF